MNRLYLLVALTCAFYSTPLFGAEPPVDRVDVGAKEDSGDAQSKFTYSPDEIVAYKTTEQGALNMHIFYPEGRERGRKRAVVVQFFGGGWAGFNPTQFYQQSAYYAEHGIVAICADYRVSGRHKTTPFEAIEDAKSAVRWIRENAKELGVDPNKIVAAGASSGGHLAASTGIIEGFDSQSENLKVSSVPNAMILFNAVLDTTESGCGASRFPGRTLESSANHHIREGLPPALVLHGTADTTTPFVNATDFRDGMHANGNICVLVPFEGAGHGFFNGSQHRSKSDNINFTRCMESAVAFIEELF